MSQINTIKTHGCGTIVIKDDIIVVTGINPKSEINGNVMIITLSGTVCHNTYIDNYGNSFSFGNGVTISNRFWSVHIQGDNYNSPIGFNNTNTIFINGVRVNDRQNITPDNTKDMTEKTIEISYDGKIKKIKTAGSTKVTIDTKNIDSDCVLVKSSGSSSCTFVSRIIVSDLSLKTHGSSSHSIDNNIDTINTHISSHGASKIKTNDNGMLNVNNDMILNTQGDSFIYLKSSFIKNINGKTQGCSRVTISCNTPCTRSRVNTSGCSKFELLD